MLKCLFEDGNETSLRHVVVDALVLKDNKILLAKRTGKILEGGKWGLVGGFVGRDETLKEAVVREILEETGYKVESVTLLTIRDNPDRPKEDRQNVAFVYFCTATEKIGNADWESEKQQWFSLDQLPPEAEFAFDHYKNVELYLQYLKTKSSLPLIP